MTKDNNALDLKTVESILSHLDATGDLFKKYHAEDGAYRIAKALKFHNEGIIDHLNILKNQLPSAQEKNADALIFHLTEWRKRWLLHEASKRWEEDERFAFENPHSYPRESAQELENYFRHLLS